MPFFLTYWKQIAAILSILALAGLIYFRGYSAGESHIQAMWDAQKVLDYQAVAKANAKTEIIESNANKVTQNANSTLQSNLADSSNYYSSHRLPISRMRQPIRETSSSQVSSVPDATGQPKESATDSISRSDYETLANDCLATTIQLNNAQEWAKAQSELNAQ